MTCLLAILGSFGVVAVSVDPTSAFGSYRPDSEKQLAETLRTGDPIFRPVHPLRAEASSPEPFGKSSWDSWDVLIARTTAMLKSVQAADLSRSASAQVQYEEKVGVWTTLLQLISLVCGQVIIVLVCFKLWASADDQQEHEAPRNEQDMRSVEFNASCRFTQFAIYAWWFSTSVGMTIFNKWLFIPAGGDFPYPIFLTSLHYGLVFLAVNCLRFLPIGQKVVPAVAQHGSFAGLSTKKLVTSILPMAACSASALIFGNMAYLHVTVSFLQICRSVKPILVFLLAIIMGLEIWSVYALFAVLGVCLSMTLIVWGDVGASPVGFVYIGLGTLADAVKIVMLKDLLSVAHLDPLSAVGVIAPFGMFFLAGPLFLMEWTNSVLEYAWGLRWVIFANGLMAVLLNGAIAFFVKVSTATSFAIAGNVIAMVTIVADVSIFSTTFTMVQIFGFVLALGSMEMYRHRKKPEGSHT